MNLKTDHEKLGSPNREKVERKEEPKGKKNYGRISESLTFMSCESQEGREAMGSIGMRAGDSTPQSTPAAGPSSAEALCCVWPKAARPGFRL